MRGIVVMLVVSAALVSGVHFANAEEDLFDTKAAAVYTEKGIDHLKEKKYDAAIKELEEAVSINPDAEAYYYLGYAYYMKGRKGDAESRRKSIECFDKAYELNPNFTPSRYRPPDAAAAEPKPKTKTESSATEAPEATPQTAPTGT